MPSLSLKASINYPIIGGSSSQSPLLNGLLHYWSFDDTIDLDTNQLWYSPKVAGSPYFRHRTRASDAPVVPDPIPSGDPISNFGITQGILGNATFGAIIAGQQLLRYNNCVFTTANNSTTPVNIPALGSVFTINLWTKADAETNNWSIFSKHPRVVNAVEGINLMVQNTGLSFNFTGENIVNLQSEDNVLLYALEGWSLEDNTWRMVSIVSDGELITMYVNGNGSLPEGLTGYNQGTITGPVDSMSLPLNVNFDQGNFTMGGAFSIGASQDELGIWDRALTNSELLELYNNGLGKAYPFS
jgi:hypothetical protein